MQMKVLLAAVLAGVATAQDLVTALNTQPTLSTLASLLSAQPALISTLAAAKNITILALNNDAFATFLATKFGRNVEKDPSTVAGILTYHVLNGTYPASAITTTPVFLPSLLTNSSFANVTGGQRVEVVKMGTNIVTYSGLKMNSTVVTADLKFDGGIIHILDAVLQLPLSDTITAEVLGLSSLAGALSKASLGLVNDLRDSTIFAPNNDAFKAIGELANMLDIPSLSALLQHHVVQNTLGYSPSLRTTVLTALDGGRIGLSVSGSRVFVDEAEVVVEDVIVSNGVMHVINAVLNPNTTIPQQSLSTSTATSTKLAFTGVISATEPPFTSGVITGIEAATATGAAVRREGGVAKSVGFGALVGGALVLMAGF